MNRLEQNRRTLNMSSTNIQASIPGVGVARHDDSVLDGFDRLNKAAPVAFEVSNPLKMEMVARPTDQNSYNWRSKGRGEVMRQSQEHTTNIHMKKAQWNRSHTEIGDGTDIETIIKREQHQAKGFFQVADGFEKLSQQTGDGQTHHSPKFIAQALSHRANHYNDKGVQHNVRALVAEKGITGLMSQYDITRETAQSKIKMAKADDMLEAYHLADAAKKGVEFDPKGPLGKEALKTAFEEKSPDLSQRIMDTRLAIVDVHFDKFDRSEGRKERMIKRAGMRRLISDAEMEGVDSKKGRQIDKEIAGWKMDDTNPIVKSHKAVRMGLREREEALASREDSMAR